MSGRSGSLVRAILILIGAIIGAGIFALPAAFTAIGILPATILFACLAIVTTITHLLLAEAHLLSPTKHRLTGLAHRTLGSGGQALAALTYPLSIIGSNFIYLILGGEFLGILFRHFGFSLPTLTWQILFWVFGALIITLRLRWIGRIEGVATRLLIISLLIVMALVAAERPLAWGALSTADWRPLSALRVYGIFLFSLGSIPAIGEVVESVNRRRGDARRAIVFGTLFSAFLSWMFGVIFFLADGGRFGGALVDLVPARWAWMFFLTGFLAVATSLIVTADDLKLSLAYDYGFHKRYAWIITVFVPLSLLLLTQRNFYFAVQTVGVLFGGANGILAAWIAHSNPGKNRSRARRIRWSARIVVIAYLLGILYWIFSILSR